MSKHALLIKNISLSIIFLIISTAIIPPTVTIAKDNYTTDSDCYGFIIPLPSGKDTTYETFQDSKVRNLVNDLLRENITVYWSTSDFSVSSKKMDNNSNITKILFKKGAYIIRFSDDIYQDALITAVVYDYNKTCEIKDNNSIPIEAYKLMSPLNIDAYELAEPKIAQHYGTPTRYGWPAYLQIAEAGGFLTMELLLDDETTQYLNNKDFNVFMWPYNPARSKNYETVISLLNKDGCNAIRQFVRNGGGYIGSCYGALAASAGILLPIPNFSLKHVYNPDLQCTLPYLTLSISDSLMYQNILPLNALYISTTEIDDTDHPVAWGHNKTVTEFFEGPWFLWTGPNTPRISTFTDLQTDSDFPRKSLIINSVVGSPNWVHSTFGDGKIVLYSSHPEFVNNIPVLMERFNWTWGDRYYGRRTIHNALFYVSSKGLVETVTNTSYPVTIIEEMGEKTIDLPIEDNNSSEFDDIKKRIHKMDTNLSYLRNTSIILSSLYADIANGSDYLEDGWRLIYYMYYFCKILSDYNDKTLISLDKLERVYPMFAEFNESVLKLVEGLKSDLSERLNQSDKIIFVVKQVSENLMSLMQNELNILQKLRVFAEVRYLLRTYAIELKFVPQMYFETLKLLRYSWYNYEANTALSRMPAE